MLPIQHALKICSAWALSNYHSFFQLYLCAPNMSGYLIDLFVKTERTAAIKAMIKSWVHFVHIYRMILDLLQYLSKISQIQLIEIQQNTNQNLCFCSALVFKNKDKISSGHSSNCWHTILLSVGLIWCCIL